ncbi:nucleotidyltransferase domain-containing protein [bacterium]|nr:nucleotidyltransferase domain-containing protein [bacterium]
MTDASDVARILVSHAVASRGHQVAIVLVYGSRASGHHSPDSDLDICYIPDGDGAADLSSQFVLDGLPYDFWPLSWASAEAIANGLPDRPWAFAASLIAGAKVLYHRSQVDLDRFVALQDRIDELTRPESYAYMVAGALRQFPGMLAELGRLRLAHRSGDERGRYAAGWRLVGGALDCLARLNQTYFTGGLGKCLPQVLAMEHRPEGLETMLRGITNPVSGGKVLEHAECLAAAVRSALLVAQALTASPVAPREVFADFYFYVVEWVGKIRRACECGDVWAAGAAAWGLEGELASMLSRARQGLGDGDFNLLGDYRLSYAEAQLPDLVGPAATGDLELLARRAGELQATFGKWLESQSVPLGVLRGEEELKRFLASRLAP